MDETPTSSTSESTTKGRGGVEIIVLTPDTIPDYARKTGRDADALLAQYSVANMRNQILYGYIYTEYFIDDVATAEKDCPVGCGHPPDDHEDGRCMHLCDCAWPSAKKEQ